MKAVAKLICVCGVIFVASAAAMAQSENSSCGAVGKIGGFQGVRAVSGCPFSATLQIEHTQALADGTQIHTTVTGALYRDSAGRIRYETKAPISAGTGTNFPAASAMVEIFDPVAGVTYFMLPQRSHTANRHVIDQPPANESERASPGASAPSFTAESESIGTQQIAGLTATGVKNIRRVPKATEGNDREIVVVSETWRSLELGIPLLRKTSDPRTGDTETRVTSIERFEPDPALFQVPSDYTIKDQ